MRVLLNKSRVVRPLLCSVCILGLILCFSGRVLPGSKASAAQAGSVTLRVDVELITVDVFVLDKKGSPVRNLNRENFQLFEDGKRQEIATFAEISDDPNEAVPTSLADIDENGPNRGKVVLILFDDSHLTPGRIQLTRESAEKYVKENMRPLDLFAVASFGMSLKILQNYTHDAAKVVEAIRQPAVSFATPTPGLQGIPGTGPQGMPGNRPGTVPRLPGEGQESRYQVAALFHALNSLSLSVAPVKGRKVVLLYSEDFSAGVDVQTEFTSTVDFAKKANVAFYTIDARGLSAGLPGISQFPDDHQAKSPKASLRAASTAVRSVYGRLAPLGFVRDTGAWGLLASSMFQQGGGQSGGGQGGGQRGGNPPSSGGSGSGGQPPGGTGGRTIQPTNPAPNTPNTNSNTNTTTSNRDRDRQDRQQQPQFAQQRLENLLRSLASETGGLAIYNTGDFNTRLNEVNRELSNYYVLGFQSNNPKRDGRFRKLEVKTDVKGMQVKHRDGYFDPRPLDVLAGSKGEKSLMSAMAAPTMATQLPVSFQAVYFYDSPGLARIPVTASIRTESVVLKKKGGQLNGDINVMGIAYAEDGSVSARFSETLNVLIDKEKEDAWRKQDLQYRNRFRLRPGKYLLKVAAADEKGKVGSAEQSLVIPPMPQDGLAGSSLVLVDRIARLPDLIQALHTKLLDESDPLLFKGYQILPSVGNQLAVNAPINTIFKIYNLSDRPELLKLVAKVQLLGENGETMSLPPIPLDELLFVTGKTEAVVGIKLPFKNMAPGKYRLVVSTSEEASKRSVTLQTELQYK